MKAKVKVKKTLLRPQ